MNKASALRQVMAHFPLIILVDSQWTFQVFKLNLKFIENLELF
jgi:hypothetical protein